MCQKFDNVNQMTDILSRRSSLSDYTITRNLASFYDKKYSLYLIFNYLQLFTIKLLFLKLKLKYTS